MEEESHETLFLSEHSTASSDHVVLSSSAIAEAQFQHQRDFCSTDGDEDGGLLSTPSLVRLPRPSAIMREWFDDIKRRVLMTAPSSLSANDPQHPQQQHYDDEYCLVHTSDSLLSSEHHATRLDDSHEVEGLEVSMMVDIHSDPMVELMLENRISRLEMDLEACEIEYEKRIRALEYELQHKSIEQSKDNFVYQSRIQELELKCLSLQQENESLRISVSAITSLVRTVYLQYTSSIQSQYSTTRAL